MAGIEANRGEPTARELIDSAFLNTARMLVENLETAMRLKAAGMPEARAQAVLKTGDGLVIKAFEEAAGLPERDEADG
ncbi:hypothetical protein A2971_04485 [Candidatus Gottesmanbacteria bacterium RIFCSPLOWO2_01_FULL_46_21]|nr:MAG: hypothetical protein A2971_04485 [Candidatus Gottesmanbacteria bacterium RIFCSPLOWO2_01_FULL_46_21]